MRRFFLALFISLHIAALGLPAKPVAMLKINTSNANKLVEFQYLFAKYKIQPVATKFDLPEIVADPLQVVAHKASQLDDGIIVEDTSLDIEGADVGINVRWLIDHLEEHVGKRAVWTVLLAYKYHGQVYVFSGQVTGTIVQGRGKWGFGFDRIFQPDMSTKTLAESKPDSVNARAYAVDALMHDNLYATLPAITSWDGAYQNSES